MGVLGLASLPSKRNGQPASDGSRPHLRKAHALFTLVGIAGEDDMDAPDLLDPRSPVEIPTDANGSIDRKVSNGARRKSRPPKLLLATEASAVLRGQLLTEIAELKAV